MKFKLVRGALSELRIAIFPIAGAIGGMHVPILVLAECAKQ
ncbi:Na+/H+ antiporter NhaA [Sphingobium sp. YR768]